MTAKEAIHQAMRELGKSEDYIQSGWARLAVEFPEISDLGVREVPPEHEREVIEKLKAKLLDQKFIEESWQKSVEERQAKNLKN